jgi:hypothetical protein
LAQIIDRALEMEIPQVSFLAADVGPDSFNRGVQPLPKVESSPARDLLLDAGEVKEFDEVVESVIHSHARELAEGRATPGPAGLRRLVRYYAAHLGLRCVCNIKTGLRSRLW